MARHTAAIKAAIKDLEKTRSSRLIADALRLRNGPDVAKPSINDPVLVWRAANANTGTGASWQGPYLVRAVDDETVTVDFGNGVTGDFRSTSVRPYLSTGTADEIAGIIGAAARPSRGRPRAEPAAPATTPAVPADTDTIVVASTPAAADTPDAVAVPVRRSRGRPRRNAPAAAFAYLSGLCVRIWITAPAPVPSYDVSRRLEIFGLLEKGVFEPVNRTEIPAGTRIFNGRFVDEIKHAGTAHAIEKSRFVVQAYHDTEKETVLTESPTIQRMSQRLLLCVAACKTSDNACLYLRDISQAYVQATCDKHIT